MQQVSRAANVTMATAASSAQREPSMEEILASIRRIIEDSDSGRKAALESEAGQYEEAAAAASASVEETAPEVDAFRSELRTEAPSKPVSLAEVQAQLTAEDAEHERPAASVITLAEIGAMTARSAPAGSQAAATHDEMTARTGWPREVEAVSDERVEKILKPEHAVSELPDGGISETLPKGEARVGSALETAALRPSLISEHTSRQVAASFEELSEAFAGRAKKTFDDMAAEMLRPMLQDWLDNNLPTLVERLVREEIERVARGS